MSFARTELEVPERFKVEPAVAIGRMADRASLTEALQARETPNDRWPLAETVHRGSFR